MSAFGDKSIFNFNDSNEKQKPYSERFIEWLKTRPKITGVVKGKLSEDKQGIDYWITTSEGEYSIQLKVDGWADKTGNLPVETISQAYSTRNSVIGAEFNMYKVDYIFFLLIPSQRLLGFNFKNFLEYVIQHFEHFNTFGADNDNTGYKYRTLGCLIPIKKIIHLAIFDTKLD